MAASSRMNMAVESVRFTTTGPMALGSMCLYAMTKSLRPKARMDCTYSSSRKESIFARACR